MSCENKNYNFNEEDFAIITKKALENKKIRKAVRTDEVAAVDDSGWKLYFGDEDEEYLKDPANAALTTLEAVIAFEPLLADIFGEEGFVYIYDEDEKRFVSADN